MSDTAVQEIKKQTTATSFHKPEITTWETLPEQEKTRLFKYIETDDPLKEVLDDLKEKYNFNMNVEEVRFQHFLETSISEKDKHEEETHEGKHAAHHASHSGGHGGHEEFKPDMLHAVENDENFKKIHQELQQEKAKKWDQNKAIDDFRKKNGKVPDLKSQSWKDFLNDNPEHPESLALKKKAEEKFRKKYKTLAKDLDKKAIKDTSARSYGEDKIGQQFERRARENATHEIKQTLERKFKKGKISEIEYRTKAHAIHEKHQINNAKEYAARYWDKAYKQKENNPILQKAWEEVRFGKARKYYTKKENEGKQQFVQTKSSATGKAKLKASVNSVVAKIHTGGKVNKEQLKDAYEKVHGKKYFHMTPQARQELEQKLRESSKTREKEENKINKNQTTKQNNKNQENKQKTSVIDHINKWADRWKQFRQQLQQEQQSIEQSVQEFTPSENFGQLGSEGVGQAETAGQTIGEGMSEAEALGTGAVEAETAGAAMVGGETAVAAGAVAGAGAETGTVAAAAATSEIWIPILIVVIIVLLVLLIFALIIFFIISQQNNANQKQADTTVPGLTITLTTNTPKIANGDNQPASYTAAIACNATCQQQEPINIFIDPLPQGTTVVNATPQFTTTPHPVTWQLAANTPTATITFNLNTTAQINNSKIGLTVQGESVGGVTPSGNDFFALTNNQGRNVNQLGTTQDQFVQKILANAQKGKLGGAFAQPATMQGYLQQIYQTAKNANVNPVLVTTIWGVEAGWQVNNTEFGCKPFGSGFADQLSCSVNTLNNFMKQYESGTKTIANCATVFAGAFPYAYEWYTPVCHATDGNDASRKNFTNFYKILSGI